jgi:hypothetical protein
METGFFMIEVDGVFPSMKDLHGKNLLMIEEE